ncbi:MAG: hypothetical protein NVS3B5_13240 [Sphingomicrobium sp.]
MASQPYPTPPPIAGHELQALAENLPNLAWIASGDGSIVWYNRAWYEYTGCSPEELLGWGWSSVHHPDELERVTAEWLSAIATGSTVELIFPLRRHDGSFRPFLTRAVPIRDPSGQIVRWFGTNVDISAQVDAEQRLRRAEADWRGLFDEMHEGIILGELIHDEQGKPVDARILRANSRIEAVTGIPAHDATGLGIRAMVGEATDHLLEPFARVVETGVSEALQVRVETLSRSFEVRVYRHATDQFAALYLDVTGRKQAEQHARRAQERLLRVSRLSTMGAMASTLSHELNQPIGAASNFLSAANEHVKRATTLDRTLLRGLFESAIASCQRAGQIIRSMRDFTASGTVTKKPEAVRELLQASIDECLGGASADDIEFCLDCPPAMPTVLCDRTQMSQILLNLFANSAHAMAGAERKRIAISASSTRSSLVLRIEDNGPGFKDRTPEQLFEPFWSSTDVGLGLGLPLCRTIVEAHGGTICAEAGRDGGAAFVIELPQGKD